MDTWHVIDRAGRQHGPLSHYDAAKTIQSGMASGAFGPESEIWHHSFGATWKTIATSEFAHLLGQSGPPPRGPSGPPREARHADAQHHQPMHHHARHQPRGTSGWDSAPFTAGVPFFPEKSVVVIVYVLYLLGIASFFITPLIGLIIAYVQRGSSTPTGRSHFTFQVHTFWLSVLYVVLFYVAAAIFLALFAGIGFVNPVAGWSGFGLWIMSFVVIAIGQFVWHLVRVIKGLVYANGSRPIANPTSWWLG